MSRGLFEELDDVSGLFGADDASGAEEVFGKVKVENIFLIEELAVWLALFA